MMVRSVILAATVAALHVATSALIHLHIRATLALGTTVNVAAPAALQRELQRDTTVQTAALVVQFRRSGFVFI